MSGYMKLSQALARMMPSVEATIGLLMMIGVASIKSFVLPIPDSGPPLYEPKSVKFLLIPSLIGEFMWFSKMAQRCQDLLSMPMG